MCVVKILVEWGSADYLHGKSSPSPWARVCAVADRKCAWCYCSSTGIFYFRAESEQIFTSEEKKEGAVDPVSFKICCYHLPGLQIKAVLPHQKLFMNQGAWSWRRRFFFHCLTHYQQSLGNLCWLLLLHLHCQKLKESSSYQHCNISLNLSVFSFFLEVFILRKAAAGYLSLFDLGTVRKVVGKFWFLLLRNKTVFKN